MLSGILVVPFEYGLGIDCDGIPVFFDLGTNEIGSSLINWEISRILVVLVELYQKYT